MANQRKISSLLINPEFQGKFVAIFTIFGFFQAFVNYYAVYFSFKQIKASVNGGVTSIDQLQDLVQLQEFYVFTFIGITFALSFLIFVFVGLRFTHNAAGALYRFKVEFGSMKDKKELHPVTLRKGDFFRDVASSFNEVVEVITGKPVPKEKGE